MQKCPETTQEPANSLHDRKRRKYCPLFVAAFGGPYTGEGPDTDFYNAGRRCLGSECAWWTLIGPGGVGGCAVSVLAGRMAQAAAGLAETVGCLDALVGGKP